jgi:phosphopantothenoylcysteine decarboxylase
MVLHIELRKWADLFLIAPLDANTLAKVANGICDSCLTSVYRCWDLTRPVVIAPAMNTLMWEHPVTDRNLKQLQQDCKILRICWPQEKLLACGDMGTGAMASIPEILSQCYLDQKNS